jgi:hypothetical protein
MGVGVTISVATYGDSCWIDLATRRAIPSALAQGVPVVYVHGLTLHGARNAALEQVATEHVVFLDADDELRPGYCDALAAGTADLRAPAVQYVTSGGRPQAPYVPRVAGHQHDCTADCLTDGNWIVVGAMARTDLLRSVGGWEAFEWSEDWALWARCWRAGATIETISDAVYVAHVNPASRNRAPDHKAKNRAHWEIHRAVWPERYEGAA